LDFVLPVLPPFHPPRERPANVLPGANGQATELRVGAFGCGGDGGGGGDGDYCGWAMQVLRYAKHESVSDVKIDLVSRELE
jgi:hypothetical protein